MPSQRPSAAFDPISPDLDLAALVEETPNFEYVTRVSCDMIEAQSMEAFEKLILLHVILGGKPLVIEGFQKRLDEWTFTSQWLQDNCGKKFEQARNLTKKQNMALSIGHYLNNMPKLTDQWNASNFKEPDRQRIYLKDIDCPPLWVKKLEEQIPPGIFYMNESTGEIGGPGSMYESNSRGVARAGDLMSCLPPVMRADNLMCYIGHEGTYTPAHREMCASLGQNLMVETSDSEDGGKAAKPGSSIWFMTETSDRHLVSEYWLSTLGHDIEVESHFAQINAWKAAPFTTYIIEQKAGDFVLIPPLAPHQVWNRGTRTMKVAWNRTTVETLEIALHEALPRARMVCRDEQYKNKAIIYFALQKYSDLLKLVDRQKQTETNQQLQMELNQSAKIRQMQKDFTRLFYLFTEILVSEMLAPVSPNEKRGQYLPYDSFVTCSYCRCNIFNRFLTCTSCIEPLENGEENTYDICMDCFVMGRSCSCISQFKWVEQFPWQELATKHESWRQQIIGFDRGHRKPPQSLQAERKKLGKKTLAQVCQEQLKIRPWNDPQNPTSALKTTEMAHPKGYRDSEQDLEEGSKLKKGTKTKIGILGKGFIKEHVSCHPRERWKVACCTTCDRAYSYGSLWRMFDMMPLTVMGNPNWECPACLMICSCGSCRKKIGIKPYEPHGTVLGHDTKKVADPRSVESLVDFGVPNLHHIKKFGDDDPFETRRLGRRRDEAARAKAMDPELDENYTDDEPQLDDQFVENGIRYTTDPDIPIDPMLSLGEPSVRAHDEEGSRVPDGDGQYGKGSSSNRNSNDGSHTNSAPLQKGGPKHKPAKSGLSISGNDSIYGSGINLRPPTGVAPLANMMDHQADRRIDDRARYSYPDSTMSHTTPLHQDTNDLQSNVSLGQNDPEHQSQLHRIFEEAKQNDRAISVEASITGRRLPIKLRLAPRLLAAIQSRPRQNGNLNTRIDGAKPFNKELLQSDYPSSPNTNKPNVSKKRKLRTSEIDDDFSVRKQPRKAYISQPVPKPKKSAECSEEITSGSDVALEESNSFVPANKPRGPRRLPKYLAERAGEADYPSELPDDSARRKSFPLARRRSPPKEADALGTRSVLGLGIRSELSRSAPHHPTIGSSNEQEVTSSLNIPIQDARASRESSTLTGAKSQASKLAEANRKAKMKAVQWADKVGETVDSDSSLASSTSSEQYSTRAESKSMSKSKAIPPSMFSRPGVAGKKIKVVGSNKAAMNGDAAHGPKPKMRRSLP